MKILYILSALGTLALLAEIFRSVPLLSIGKKLLLPVILIGLLGAIASAVYDWNTSIHYFNNMLTFDNYALLFSILICAISFLWFLMAGDFFRRAENKTDRYALVLFAVFGAVLMASYSNMVMLFLGIEILSIPMYVLAGSRKDDLFSNESSLKYFLMGAFATGFLLFGIALLYGTTGTFDLSEIQRNVGRMEEWKNGNFNLSTFQSFNVLLTGGILFILIGLSFKVAAVPFHFWMPDVYHGAPTPVTAFMASIVKTAAFAAFLRLFLTCFSETQSVWNNVLWALAALTILLGNITAVYQTNVKRMLAYSSISHAGYMLLAILAMNENSAGSILYYAAAYSVSTIAAFAVLYILEGQGTGDKGQVNDNRMTTNDAKQMTAVTFDSLAGLSKQNSLLAFAMTIAMLSLAGIPPLAGFFGKYYIFTAALKSGYLYLVLIAVAGSLIGVYYYFRVIIKMYGPYGEDAQLLPFGKVGWGEKIVLLITILLSILLGIFPEWLIILL